MITSERLTKEINKALPSSSILPTGIAFESKQEDRTAYVKLQNVTTKVAFLNLVKTVEDKLTKSPYVPNFLIVYQRDLLNNPLLQGFYVCAWNNPEEYQLALKVKLTLQMEELLNLQKQVLAKKQELLECSKVMLANKQTINA